MNYPSPWNKSPNEWECPDCGCWSELDEPCWYCEEQAAALKAALEDQQIQQEETKDA